MLRAAVVGGGAYMAGRRHGQRSPSVPKQGGEMGPDQQAPSVSDQQAPSVSDQQAPSVSDQQAPSVSDQLAQLSTLHAQGSLSDAEFAAAKSRLLDKWDPIA